MPLEPMPLELGRATGRKPLRINVLKFAESHRTKNFSVKSVVRLV